jgi:hypothetical protein
MGCAWKEWKDLLFLLLLCMHAGRCSCCSNADMETDFVPYEWAGKVTAQARSGHDCSDRLWHNVSDRCVLLMWSLTI